MKVSLIDAAGNPVAAAQVADEGGYFGGAADLGATPPNLRALFDDFEECVSGQMFSRVDEVQGKIAAFGIRAVFDDGAEVGVKDLQVFPSTGDISFRAATTPAHAASDRA